MNEKGGKPLPPPPPPLSLPRPSTSFCAAFVVAAGLSCNVQPCTALPPNTGITLVADVAGTTVFADKTFWQSKCSSIPTNALFLVLKMGDVTDFFKPADASTSYCDMLQTHDKHQWSPNGLDWFAVTFGHSGRNGGSASNGWPRDKGVEGDARDYLSFWGSGWGGGETGGCCSSTAVDHIHHTGMSLVADVPGSTVANDAFWAKQCKTIPPSTLFLVLDMGTVRDFFKPADAGTSYCEMLQADDKHQWSPNGVDWFAVEFYNYNNHNGGSASWLPRDEGVEGDAREHLSFWGIDGSFTGGCCSTSTAVAVT
eukprot:gene7309-biopygen16917